MKLPYFANCNGNRDKKYRHSVYRMVLHIWKGYLFRRSKGGDLYKRVNGTFPKISTQSLRIIKLLHRKQGKIFTKSNEYYVRKISCAWGMPGFRIHSFQDYRRKIEMGTTVGVQVPRIIPL